MPKLYSDVQSVGCTHGALRHAAGWLCLRGGLLQNTASSEHLWLIPWLVQGWLWWQERRTWLAFAAGSALFAGLTSVLAKCGVRTTDSTVATAIRTSVVLIFAWAIVFIQGAQEQILGLDGRTALFLVLSGLATGASWLCFFRALQEGPASLVVPIDKLSILVSIAFGAIVFHERLSRRGAVGLVMVTVGTLVMLL